MKPVNQIINVTPTSQQKYTPDQYRKVKTFVASIYSLFTDYRGDFTKEEFFKDECRMWADDIIKFSNDDERLNMVKKLIAVAHMKELHGNYKTAKSTLAIACVSIEHLNHDYWIAYPRVGSTGALDEIKRKELEYNPEQDENAKNHIKKLKDIFNE